MKAFKNISSFENKALIVFTMTLIAGLTAINFVSILFYKEALNQQILKEANLYYEILTYNPEAHTSQYIRISDSFILDKNYELIGIRGGRFFFIDRNYKNSRIKMFALNLLVWEAVLVLSSILIVYIVIIRYIKREEHVKKYLEILLLTISHKLGNFLSIQKVNIDLIKTECNIKAVDRIERAYLFMERDFKVSLEVIKNLSDPSVYERTRERINIRAIIEEVLSYLVQGVGEKDIKLRLVDAYIRANRADIENIIFPVIENAFRFSKEKIYIKMCIKRGVYIFVRNDVVPAGKGSGIGLKIAKFLLDYYGGDLKVKYKKRFLVAIYIPI